MGITVKATNSSYEFDMGCGGFFNLRKNIALAMDKEFGENYAGLAACRTDQDYHDNDATAGIIVLKNHLMHKYADVLDFLYMPDEEGMIAHTTCKKIADLLEQADLSGKSFRYAAQVHNDYAEFIAFLKECYRYHRKMRWF